MLATSYEAKLKADSMARRQRLNAGPVPPQIEAPIEEKPAVPIPVQPKAVLARTTVNAVLRAACEYFGVTREVLLSKSRSGYVVYRRHIAMFIARELTDATTPQIAVQFGDMDHTSILHGSRRVREALKDDLALAEDVDAIRQRAMKGAAGTPICPHCFRPLAIVADHTLEAIS